nr:hypothetical protein [Tanacetum cinerariifolium]
IREEIREEFCTGSGSLNAGGNPPPVTIHTWLERFNKQKPYSFEKATAPVDAENWISHMEKIFDVMGCEDAFKTRLAVCWHRGGACEELSVGSSQATLNHLMCMSYTDVAQVSNAARNYEILHERDDKDTERPDKRQRSSDRHQPTSQQSSHRSHGHNNDRHGSDRRGGNDNHRGSNNNNYSSSNNKNSGNGRDQRYRGHQSNRSANSGSQQSRGPSEGYSYPVCTTCGRRHQGECRRAAGTCFKCGQAGHLQKDYKKNTTTSTSGQADKKSGASGRVFAITEGQAANTSGTITDTLFIYGHAVFVLFDTGATHSVISSTFASRITTTPKLLDHVLCISTPMQDSMVNTRTDADLSSAVQNALQTLLPQIREEIREEFRTGSESSNAGGNPPPVTIHTWLERFNKQKPHSFEKATVLVDAENWISHMEKIFDVMGCENAFKTRLAVYKFEGNALAWWKP